VADRSAWDERSTGLQWSAPPWGAGVVNLGHERPLGQPLVSMIGDELRAQRRPPMPCHHLATTPPKEWPADPAEATTSPKLWRHGHRLATTSRKLWSICPQRPRRWSMRSSGRGESWRTRRRFKIDVELSVILGPKITDNSTLIMAVPLGGTEQVQDRKLRKPGGSVAGLLDAGLAAERSGSVEHASQAEQSATSGHNIPGVVASGPL
jgi:hypothetical protein